MAKFDHIVIFVSNLDSAVTDFTDLGFKVTRGGSHGLTENALIIFANQTYIELLALKPFWHSPLMHMANRLGLLQWQSERQGSIYCRLVRWVNGDIGPVDWCVSVPDLDSTLSQWREAKQDVLISENFSRERIDGGIVRWRLGGTKDHDVPFLLEDITPSDHRVPLAETTDHPNGADALKAVQFKVPDKDSANKSLTSLLLPALAKEEKQRELTLGQVNISFEEHNEPYKISLIISSPGKQPQHLDFSKSHGTSINLEP